MARRTLRQPTKPTVALPNWRAKKKRPPGNWLETGGRDTCDLYPPGCDLLAPGLIFRGLRAAGGSRSRLPQSVDTCPGAGYQRVFHREGILPDHRQVGAHGPSTDSTRNDPQIRPATVQRSSTPVAVAVPSRPPTSNLVARRPPVAIPRWRGEDRTGILAVDEPVQTTAPVAGWGQSQYF
jgi:hypothetical protein